MNISVSIRGGPELVAKLKRLSDDVAGETLETAVLSGALLVQNAAKEKARWRTGNLRRSIHIGGHSSESELSSSDGKDIGGNKRDRNSAEVLVGTNVVYARRIEYGFSGTDSLGRSYNQPPHPYLRPAMDEKKEAVAKEIGEALKILLREL